MTKQTFDFIVDVTRSIIWQYNDASNLIGIIQNKQDWLDENVKQFWLDWYDNVYNLDTANEFGLKIWAIILGLKFSSESATQTSVFGFNYSTSGALNFTYGGFAPSSDVILTTEQKRTILKLRYRQLISNGTIDEMHRAVSSIIPGAFIFDGLNMTVTLSHPTRVSSDIMYILENYDVIPRPAGVEINYAIGYGNWLGFDGSGGQNFNNSIFGG